MCRNLNYWDSVSTLAGEVPRPHRTVPRALAGAVVLVVVTYVIPLLAGVGVTTQVADWKLGYFAHIAQKVLAASVLQIDVCLLLTCAADAKVALRCAWVCQCMFWITQSCLSVPAHAPLLYKARFQEATRAGWLNKAQCSCVQDLVALLWAADMQQYLMCPWLAAGGGQVAGLVDRCRSSRQPDWAV